MRKKLKTGRTYYPPNDPSKIKLDVKDMAGVTVLEVPKHLPYIHIRNT